MKYIVDWPETIFPLGVDSDTSVVDVSWAVELLKADKDRNTYTVSAFSNVLPAKDTTWIEWQADEQGTVRAGAFIVRRDIPSTDRATAITDQYIFKVLIDLAPGTGMVPQDFTAFALGDLADAPPAHHMLMIVTWLMVDEQVPEATCGYFMYLDQKGAPIESYLVAIDLTKAETDLQSWHNCLPVLYALSQWHSGQWQLTSPCHTAGDLQVHKLRPDRLL